MATPLTDAITALTTYANGITGKSDANLPDAVRSLADGYGGGSGLEYEEGTYTPSVNEIPTINFANSHTKAPALVMMWDTTTEFPTTTTNIFIYYMYISYLDLWGIPRIRNASENMNAEYWYARVTSSTTNISMQSGNYGSRNDVTASGFSPYAGANNYFLPAGHTFKWIAIWK